MLAAGCVRGLVIALVVVGCGAGGSESNSDAMPMNDAVAGDSSASSMDGNGVTLPVSGLLLELPAAPVPDIPFPVVVRTADGRPLTTTATLRVGSIEQTV